ncbi:ATP-binding protein [Myceligenerans cantabricum]
MLVRFEVKNYRSIASEVELSMVAVDRDREAAHDAPNLGESILTRSAVYGPNASGKSNVLAALVWLADAVRDSLRAWEDEIPIEQFAFASEPNHSTTEFTVDYLVNGVRFEYLLEVDATAILREELFHYPNKKSRRIFERNGQGVELNRELGSARLVLELLTPTTLLLSLAARFDLTDAKEFAQAIAQIRAFGKLPGRSSHWTSDLGHRETRKIFDVEPPAPHDQPPLFETDRSNERDQALALLRLADLGVSEVVFDREEVPALLGDRPPRSLLRPRLIHQTADGPLPLDLYQESEGTQTWFSLIGPVIRSLRSGTPIVFDELDASLHPVLSAALLRIFRERTTNPHGAQLIFTSHDTSLLNHLNRDEVWLTQKRPDGSTELGALADFAGERVRKSVNIEAAYLHGRYGALPEIDPTELRELGLIG